MPAPDPLTDQALSAELATLEGWRGDRNGISKKYEFPGFAQAIDFMERCAPAIDRLDHHPEWTNSYDKISVVLKTHDAGDRVTAKDIELARLLDANAP